MISQELMLGDWVMLNPDLKGYYPFAGKPCMVIGLHDDDGAIKIEYDNGKYFWTDAENDVIPIPLTPEILEKNGFEYKEPILTTFSEEKVWQIEDSNKQILIEIEEQTDDNLVDFYVGRFICGCNNCELFIKYIHELQHALKLCGIDKTIEL